MAEEHANRAQWLALRREEILEPELPIVDAHHHLWERPGRAGARVLDAQIAAGGGRFRGIRFIAKWDADAELNTGRYGPPPGLMQDRAFRAGFALLAPRRLSFDTMIYHPQIPELADLARAFPDVTIVL